MLVESLENKASGPRVKIYRKRCELPPVASEGTADPYQQASATTTAVLCYRALGRES
jgi:hypothetical protein